MTDKEKIREEVERLFTKNRERSSREGYAVVEQLREVLSFIDSLQEEPVSDDLEEAAEAHALKCHTKKASAGALAASIYDFKNGARWKENQFMKDAIEGIVLFDYYGSDNLTYGCIEHDSFCLEDRGLKDKDKVKLIIIKEVQHER